MWIPVNKLVIADYNPRLSIDAQSIAELAENIKNIDVIDPLHVRPLDNGMYEIFDGGRRFRALQLLKTEDKAPCIIHKITREEAMRLTLSGHVLREDLTTEELGLFIKRLLKERVFRSAKEIAAFLGKSQQWVSDVMQAIKAIEAETTIREIKTMHNSLDLKSVRRLAQLELPAQTRQKIIETLKTIPDQRTRLTFLEKIKQNPSIEIEQALHPPPPKTEETSIQGITITQHGPLLRVSGPHGYIEADNATWLKIITIIKKFLTGE